MNKTAKHSFSFNADSQTMSIWFNLKIADLLYNFGLWTQ